MRKQNDCCAGSSIQIARGGKIQHRRGSIFAGQQNGRKLVRIGDVVIELRR